MGAFDDLAKPVRPNGYEKVAQESSFLDNLRAGLGAGLYGYALGPQQAIGKASQSDVNEYFQGVDALNKTKGGMVGTTIGTAIPPVLASFSPWTASILGSGVVGGVSEGLQPVREGETRAANALKGLGLGAAFPALMAGGRVLKSAVIDPLTEKGTDRIAGRVLSRFASDADSAIPSARSAPELVPGSRPTLAEATLDPGLATFQETLRSVDPVQAKSALVKRSQEQAAAQLAALRGVAGTSDDIARMIAERDQVAKSLYDKALSSAPIVTDEIVARANSLMERPSIKRAMLQAKRLAKEGGEDIASLDGSVRGLHYVKVALDDAIEKGMGGATKIGKNELGKLMATKEELLALLDDMAPDYAVARKTFEQMSKPINQAQVTERLYNNASSALLEGTTADRLRGEAFARNLRNEDSLVRQATGYKGGGLDSVLSKNQVATIQAIKDDMARTAQAQGLAKVNGSPTAQFLVGKDIMRQNIGPVGLPSGWAESALFDNFLSRPASWLYGVPERNVLAKLANATVEPSTAAGLMESAKATPLLTKAMQNQAYRMGLLSMPALFANRPE